MERGAILPPVSTAVLQPAVPAGIPQRSMAVTAIRQALGVNILTPSTGVQKPARLAAHRPMITQTIAILMEAGQNTMKRSIAERRLVLPAAIRVMSMAAIGIPMVMVSATIAAQLSP